MNNKLQHALAFLVAIIFLQTLYFKFTGAPESVWIFTQLNQEPYGRIGSGVIELIAAILILIPRSRFYGSLISSAVMAGAIMSHVFILGIVIQDDGGTLFALALLAFCASTLIWSFRFIFKAPRHALSVLGLFFVFSTGFASTKISYNTEGGKGIQGYDPVSFLTQNEARKGSPEFMAEWDGVTYLFSSEENKNLFLKSPLTYIPAYGGWCAFAMADGEEVEIDPKTFKVIDGRVYLFYNGFWGNTLEKWNRDEAKLFSKAQKAWSDLIK